MDSDSLAMVAATSFGIFTILGVSIATTALQTWRTKARTTALRQYWTVPETTDFFKVDSTLLYDRSENDKVYIRDRDTLRARAPPEISGIVYQPLEQRTSQLRVLELSPAEKDDSIIRGKLMAININDAARRPYTALSYAWGSTREYATIYVDERPARIRKSLHAALLELRRRGHYRIWTDFICIDQEDVHGERPQQLRQMHTIYRMAREVVAWLGENDGITKYLRNTMDDVRHFRSGLLGKEPGMFLLDLYQLWLREEKVNLNTQPYIHKIRRDFRDRKRLIALFDKLKPHASAQINNLQARVLEFLDAVRQFVEKDYWRRAWIIQELTAGAAVEIWCGSEPNLDYHTFIDILDEMKLLQVLDHVNLGFSRMHDQVLRIGKLKSKWQPGNSIDMIEAFYQTYYAQSGRKHDEIYAIWGLAHDSKVYVPDFDYQLPMETLIQQMAEFKIQHSKTLDLICMQGLEKSPFTLPSWAPDLRLIGKHQFNERIAGYLAKWDRDSQQWTATCGSKCANTFFSADRSLLLVRCYIIGSISGLLPRASSLSDSTMPQSSSSFWVRSRRGYKTHNAESVSIFETMMIYKHNDPTQDENSDWSAVFFTSAMAYYKEKHPLTHRWLTQLGSARCGSNSKSIEDWSKGEMLRNPLKGLRRGVDSLIRRDIQGRDHLRDVGTAHREIIHAFSRVIRDDLCFFEIQTEPPTKPNLFGWAHPSAALGDQICLLEGCSMPVVLRAAGEIHDGTPGPTPVYNVIGDAYVAGAMQGQLWKSATQELKYVYLS